MSDLNKRIAALEQQRREVIASQKDIQAQLDQLDHDLEQAESALWEREYGLPLGCKLTMTVEAQALIMNNNRDAHDPRGTRHIWPVGSIVKFTDIDLGDMSVRINHLDRSWTVVGIPINLAQDMRRAFLALETQP